MRTSIGSVTVGGLGRSLYLVKKGLRTWWGGGGTRDDTPATTPSLVPASPTCAPHSTPSEPTIDPLPSAPQGVPTRTAKAVLDAFDVIYHTYVLGRVLLAVIIQNESFISENKITSACALCGLAFSGGFLLGAKLYQKFSAWGIVASPPDSISSILYSAYRNAASAFVSWWRWKETLERENARLRWEVEVFRNHYMRELRLRESALRLPQ